MVLGIKTTVTRPRDKRPLTCAWCIMTKTPSSLPVVLATATPPPRAELLSCFAPLHFYFIFRSARSMGSRKRAKPNPTPQPPVDNGTVESTFPPSSDPDTPGRSLITAYGEGSPTAQVDASSVNTQAVDLDVSALCTRTLI